MVFYKSGSTKKPRATLRNKILIKAFKMAQNHAKISLFRNESLDVDSIICIAEAIIIQSVENGSIVRDLMQIKRCLEKYQRSKFLVISVHQCDQPILELKAMIIELVDNLPQCLLKDDLTELVKLEVFAVETRPKSSASNVSDIRTSESGESGSFYSDSEPEIQQY